MRTSLLATDVDIIREPLRLVRSVPARRARLYEQQRAAATFLAGDAGARRAVQP